MSLRRADKDRLGNGILDSLIRWTLHDSVADAKPSSQVWERIEQRIIREKAATQAGLPAWHETLLWCLPSLYLMVRYPRGLPAGNWQRMSRVQVLATEAVLFNGLDFRFC